MIVSGLSQIGTNILNPDFTQVALPVAGKVTR